MLVPDPCASTGVGFLANAATKQLTQAVVELDSPHVGQFTIAQDDFTITIIHACAWVVQT